MVLLLLLLACGRPGGEPSVNGDPDRSWPARPDLDEALVDLMRRHAVPGLAACLIEDGETTWCGGYGEANPLTGLPATPSTPFLLASVSKAVSAVAVLQGVEAGALDLDAPVNAVLPFELIHPDAPRREVTLRQLLTHTSGVVDNWDALEAHYVDGDSPLPLGELLEGYLVRGGADYDPLENFHPEGPGGAFEYSNVGAALAAYTLEAALGRPFDALCEEGVLEPLGMNAGWHLADFDPELVARPTQLQRGAWDVLAHYGFPDYPDGQLRADAWSMARFLAMVAEGGALDGQRLLDADTVATMLSPNAPDLDPSMGLHWYTWTLDGEEVWGHNGGELGASTELLFRPSDGRGVVVLMNGEGRARTLALAERAVLELGPGG